MTDKTLKDFAKNALKMKLPKGEELESLKRDWAAHRAIDILRAKEDFELAAKRSEEDKMLKERRLE